MAIRREWPPLAWHCAMESRPIASPTSPLFSILSEVLQLIITYVAQDKTHLASLAQADSTCRQLARVFQFRRVELDLTPASLSLLDVLQKEASHSFDFAGLAVSPSLGICIKELIVTSGNYWEMASSVLQKSQDEADDASNEQTQRVRHIAGEICSVYFSTAYEVIPRLPNLRSLKWVMSRWTISF
ncbi:hypothetical protein F5Y16DRAFT_289626 [Xylariaceae sp. FL0255]|nr:hypothetical protein F5Y16DRAFT_289626 [Xylariaceae sp. FL0255]